MHNEFIWRKNNTARGKMKGRLRGETKLICGRDHAFVGFARNGEGGSTPDERMKGSRFSLSLSLSKRAARLVFRDTIGCVDTQSVLTCIYD